MKHKGTALVTGASSGIGAAFAHQLAAQGYHLILVARRKPQLEALASQLRHQVEVTVHPADLSDAAETTTLCELAASHPEITLLVNNAGFGTAGLLWLADEAKQLAMLRLHVDATYLLCRAVLPQMVARKSGAIINVSSIAAFFHGVENVNYCATKAYINSFSQSLQDEVKAHHISVQSLCPGYTYSEFHDSAEYDNFERSSVPDKLWMTSEEVVAISLKALGNGKVTVIPGKRNQLMVASAQNRIGGKVKQLAKKILRRS